MEALELADFVANWLLEASKDDREYFLESISQLYCVGPDGCYKPLDECKCEKPIMGV